MVKIFKIYFVPDKNLFPTKTVQDKPVFNYSYFIKKSTLFCDSPSSKVFTF